MQRNHLLLYLFELKPQRRTYSCTMLRCSSKAFAVLAWVLPSITATSLRTRVCAEACSCFTPRTQHTETPNLAHSHRGRRKTRTQSTSPVPPASPRSQLQQTHLVTSGSEITRAWVTTGKGRSYFCAPTIPGGIKIYCFTKVSTDLDDCCSFRPKRGICFRSYNSKIFNTP